MKEPITDDRWRQAQAGEYRHHVAESLDHSLKSYSKSYSHYFRLLGVNPDLDGRAIIEIGPGRIAGLLFCRRYSKSYVVEPTKYDGIKHLYDGLNLEIVRKKAEEWNFPKVDEVWLLNVLQHVQDPDKLVAKCKEAAGTIRFFEPVDIPPNNEHPFSFSVDDFRRYFGDCVQEWKEHQEIDGFHNAKCAYGVWTKN